MSGKNVHIIIIYIQSLSLLTILGTCHQPIKTLLLGRLWHAHKQLTNCHGPRITFQIMDHVPITNLTFTSLITPLLFFAPVLNTCGLLIIMVLVIAEQILWTFNDTT